MSEKNTAFLEMVFKKTSSNTKTAKINDFWKFIDSQNEIQPHIEQKSTDNLRNSKEKSCDKDDKEEKFWYKELLLFKALGLDKIALSTCKFKQGSKKHNEKLVLSDMIEQTNEEVNHELENFERRLQNTQF